MIDVRLAVCLCYLLVVLFETTQCYEVKQLNDGNLDLDLSDGVTIDDQNVTKDDINSLTISRDRKSPKKKDMFSKLLPMFIIPYLVQSAILPMILMSMKMMLIKSFFVGKIAILLGLLNVLRSRNNDNYQMQDDYKYNDDMKQMVKQHYGYGSEEYGAYIHH